MYLTGFPRIAPASLANCCRIVGCLHTPDFACSSSSRRVWRTLTQSLRRCKPGTRRHRRLHRLVQRHPWPFQPRRTDTRTGLYRWPPEIARGCLKCFHGAPRVAHRVVRSSQATPAAVDNSAPLQPAQVSVISRGQLFRQTEPLLGELSLAGVARLRGQCKCAGQDACARDQARPAAGSRSLAQTGGSKRRMAERPPVGVLP